MIKCQICNREFESLRSLGLHLSHTHKDISHKDYYDTYMKTALDGICPVCGKPTKWKGGLHGYARTCSISCGQKHTDTRNKMSKTNIEKYGASNPYGSKIIREKIKKTNIERYGVENIYQLPEVQLKARHNAHTKEAEQKRQNTCFKKYGNIYHIASDEIRQKSINTYQERYGVSNAYSIPEIHTKAIQNSLNYHDEDGNDSSWEAILSKVLVNKNIKFERHYNKDRRYPYQCDFYLPDTDTFIEINGYWMHGGHWFDETNENDINILNIWKSKADTNSMYKSAISVWTKSDLEKRNIAIKNNLNYIVLWSLDDINKYIESL